MEDKIFRTIELENNQTLVIYDRSREIAADGYVVIMGARMEIQIQKGLFDGEPPSNPNLEEIQAILGTSICYEYIKERNMIRGPEKTQVFETLVETFLKNMGPYMARPSFPKKLILKEYRERIEKKERSKLTHPG